MAHAFVNSARAVSKESVSLRDLATPLFRYKRLFQVSFASVFLLTLLATLFMQKQYQSKMEILVNRERTDPVVTTEATTQAGSLVAPITEEEINSEAELLKSQDLLEKVAKENGLDQPGRQGIVSSVLGSNSSESVRLDQAVRRLGRRLKIKAIPKSNVLEVSYSSPDAKLTYSVLNTLGRVYIDKRLSLHHAAGSYQFFAKETTRYEEAMKTAEAHLREFSRGRNAAAPDLEQAGLATQVTDSIGRLHVLEQSVAANKGRIRSDTIRLKSLSDRTTTSRSSAPPNMLLQQLGGDLLKADTKRTQLAIKYKDDYPLMREADEEVREAKQAFEAAQKTLYVTETTDRDPTHELLRQDLERAQSDLAAQRNSLGATRQSIRSMRVEMSDLNNASLDRADLERERKAAEQNYLLYLGKREQARASDVLDQIGIGNVAIAVPPAIPAVPVAGLPSLLLALGLGLLFALVVTYLAAYCDPSFHSSADVSEALGVTVISIPRKAS
jgi:uncharacterized protein involved in exopolysaccharide biosynthesis